jgi:hypothetical protein
LAVSLTNETGYSSGAFAVFSISPALTGTPTAPTASAGTNTTQIATTAFVTTAITTATSALGTMSTQSASAVAITGGTITGGTITGITDLVVADGGTGASTITANSVILGNGTSALSGNLVAPGTTGNVLTSNGTTWNSTAPAVIRGLGLNGETWQNVIGSRSSGTTYTNSTGYPIMVNVTQNASNSSNATLYVNGVWVAAFIHSAGQQGGYATMSAIVPNGATYVATCPAGIAAWAELR